jgi:hypothetical protein
MKYLAYLSVALSQVGSAAVLDVLPGDYVPLAPGDHAVTTYLYQRNAVGPYVAGRQINNAEIGTVAAAVRFTGYHAVADKMWAWAITPTWANAELTTGTMPAAFGQKASGIGDLRASATWWPVVDRANGRYLGLTAAWLEPIGSYNNRRVLNIGENRRRFALSAAWSAPVSQNLRLELIPEAAFYRANDDYLGGSRRTQDNSYALTAYLRWHVADTWELLAGGQLSYMDSPYHATEVDDYSV